MVDRTRVDAVLTDHCRLGMWESIERAENGPSFSQTVTVLGLIVQRLMNMGETKGCDNFWCRV